MPPRTLLAIIDTAQVSGPGRQLTALLGALRQRGTDARVLTFRRADRPPSPFVAFLETAGIPVVVVPERGRFDLFVVGRVRRVVREFSPGVVQTHSYKATVLAWLLRRLGERFAWVGCFHGATAETAAVQLYHRLDLRLLRSADQVVLMAESQRAALGQAGARAVVINNAVLPPPGPGTQPEGAHASFGYVGRLSPEKGVDVLLEAMALLAHEGLAPGGGLLIAGDGPEREALERQAAQLGLDEQVTFLGAVADPWAVYRRVTCVVLPSRSEGLPNVLLEALAADRAVVATAVGGVPQVLGDSAAGILVPPDNPQALGAAMQRALVISVGPEASLARFTLAGKYSLEQRVQAHLRVYQGVTAARRAPSDPAASS